MPVNIRQLAKIAGVSASTVSRAMNAETRYKVAQPTLKRISALIRKHGYTPNLAAKHLSTSHTKVIGVLFPYIEKIFQSSYYVNVLSGVADFLLATDYRFKLVLLKEESRKWDNFDFKAGEGVDGLIITHWYKFFSKKVVTKNINIPFVVINDYEKTVKTCFVAEDGFSGGKEAAQYLYAAGHRTVAVVTGSPQSQDSNDRLRGFCEFYKECNAPVDNNLIAQGDFGDNAKTCAAIDRILAKNKKFSAVFCCNDNIAFSVMHRLKERGMMCPRDVSIIGYDDDFRAATFDPPLTTIRVPLYDIAQKAADVLLRYLNNTISKSDFSRLHSVPIQLIERGSVRNIA